MKIFKKGFNYSQDGEGNRLVYHLQGCNMRCPWCANPEGFELSGVIMSNDKYLLDCICPHGAINNGKLDRSICKTCFTRECIIQHNTKGMQLSYCECSINEIITEVCSNKMMFYDGGGVTFTGGEATVQFEELESTLAELKALKINTVIETNGSHLYLNKLFNLIDELIIDCKLIDSAKHKKYTGIYNLNILNNLKLAARNHPNVCIRIPLIGEVNCSSKDFEDFRDFFTQIQGENVTFEVLYYHEMGKYKWKQCGLDYTMTKESFIQSDLRKKFINILKDIKCKYKST